MFKLREIHVVEHIDADNTKFGLRKSAAPYQRDHYTTVLKANTESQRILWVKTLRDLKMDIGRQKTSIGKNLNIIVIRIFLFKESSSSGNRASRDSQSSLILQSVAGQALEDGRAIRERQQGGDGQEEARRTQTSGANGAAKGWRIQLDGGIHARPVSGGECRPSGHGRAEWGRSEF